MSADQTLCDDVQTGHGFPKLLLPQTATEIIGIFLTFWEIHELDETIVPALCAIKINTEGNSLCPEVNRPHYGLCTVLLHNMLERIHTTRLFITSGPVQTICLCHFLIFNQNYFLLLDRDGEISYYLHVDEKAQFKKKKKVIPNKTLPRGLGVCGLINLSNLEINKQM